MNIKDISSFLAVIEEKSLLKAAVTLGITQPALSKRINRLEDELSVKLFERSPFGMVPTAAARAFYEHAVRLSREYGEAMRVVGEVGFAEKATIRVGTTPTWDRLVNEALSRYLQWRPAARLYFTVMLSDMLLGALAKGEIDFAIITALEIPPEFNAVCIFKEDVVPIVRQGHALSHADSQLKLADFLQEKWILPRPGIHPREEINKLFASHGQPFPQVQVEINGINAYSIFNLLAKTNLVSLCPSSLLPTAASAGLVPLVVPELSLDFFLYLVTRQGAKASPNVESFISHFLESISREP
ncbi:LysR family transcriptional regulator [Allopusillimonas soli]|uniref:LysR family transcriptional regulator n=1 Tax=Allopusillimonas soli TaxID=659016 RepID=A0A853FDY5_9BURK|nr:LysR family transcriptional regulator [Allopusillimonas soli]NYT38147.1 LysR family transcriptional regulator [Allopusillimonas soli]